ncbi:MAG: acyl-CoA/acyl-ACP dehydrogenase [Oscillatoria sp. SIO1A7]|nr:acyl-CoA/acyl-ACP dehydrogenase [Oscillatoria sp. SIO1A7]
MPNPNPSPEELLAMAELYLQESVAPLAAELDRNPEALREALQGLADRSLLALEIAAGTEATRQFQEITARYSGALAFLQTQHQSAGAMLAKGSNESLKQEYLPHLANGSRLLGLGFSHLRRLGSPAVKALPVPGGYLISGRVPWITGWDFFSEFILGATLPDGMELYGMAPLKKTEQADGGAIAFSEPMQLAAAQSTNTVTCLLSDWFLPEELVIAIEPKDSLRAKGKKNLLRHSFFCLGCARAGLDIIEAAARSKALPFIVAAFESLQEDLANCREAIWQERQSLEASFEKQLELRIWAIELANRCSRAAIAVSSGSANYGDHPAQRVYREALLFAVAGQTIDVMEAHLKRLAI